MHLILLPFFIATLFVKNLVTWSKMFVAAFGFQIALATLVATNVYFGYTLFATYSQQQRTSTQLSTAESRLTHQRDFWQKIARETPGHRQAREIQKTLAE